MIWNLIGTIGGKVLDIVDDVVEDKDEAIGQEWSDHQGAGASRRYIRDTLLGS